MNNLYVQVRDYMASRDLEKQPMLLRIDVTLGGVYKGCFTLFHIRTLLY